MARAGMPQQPETYAEAIRETLDPRNAEVIKARITGGAARSTQFRWADPARGTLDGHRDVATSASGTLLDVALAHDYLLVTRGAQRTCAAIADL